jgi:ribosome biogenesis protein BMS1
LNEKEKVIYAPFSGVGGIVYDHDAVYIDLGGSHSHGNPRKYGTDQNNEPKETISPFVGELRDLKSTLNEKMESAGLKFFSASEEIKPSDIENDDVREDNESEEEDVDESEGEENSQRNEEDTSCAAGKKSIQIVQADDGRLRRKVLFADKASKSHADDPDDFTQLLKNEVKQLKKSAAHEKVQSNAVQASESTGLDDSSDSEEEVQVEQAPSPTKNQKKSRRQTKDRDGSDINLMSLATKLKARLSKDEGAEEPKVNSPGSEEEESESDVGLESFDEEMEDDQGEEDEDEEVSEDDDESDAEEESGNTYALGEDPESVNVEKQMRYSEAEDGFYSRFHKRSLQKMIYDDTSDYMNVTSRADFDLANCTVQEVEGEDEMDEDALKDLFVGGDYAEAAKNLLDDDDSDVGSAFGEFEELDKKNETERESDAKEDVESERAKAPVDSSNKKERKREEMKRKLKERFDMEYDEGGEKSFYKDWKSQVEEQTKVSQILLNEQSTVRNLDLQFLINKKVLCTVTTL